VNRRSDLLATVVSEPVSSAKDVRVDGQDGRVVRKLRNRELVLDAVLELFAEDSLETGAAEVAERSGVSMRSVYRYFEDGDALIRAAIARNLEKVRPLFVIAELGDGPLAGRIDRMVAGRLRLYEAIAPMMRATIRRAPSNDIIRGQFEVDLAAMRRQVEQMFALELSELAVADRRDAVAALDVLLGFHTFEQLRRIRGFSGPDTRRVLTRAVQRQLGAGQTHPPA